MIPRLDSPLSRSIVSALVLVLALPFAAQSQTGSITGRVTRAQSGDPVAGARVEVITSGSTIARAATDADGVYRLVGLPAGAYDVAIAPPGYALRTAGSVSLEEGEKAVLDVVIQPIELAAIIVQTVSRNHEGVIGSPQTAIRVDQPAIENTVAITPAQFVRSAPGIDWMPTGVQSGNLVARGFNNIFSGALLVLKDHRIASVPSLRVNLLHFIPSTSSDLESIEVVLGPGSALYGPNTANGVLHLLTKSPLQSPGSYVSFAAGERSVRIGEFRTAHRLSDRVGFKVSGQVVRGREWRFIDPVEQAARDSVVAGGDIDTRIGLRDFDIARGSVDMRTDWRIAESGVVTLSAGRTYAGSGIELTAVGGAQAKDWTYSYAQATASYRRLFAQAYINTSDAGDTYLLRDGSTIVDRSRLLVAQVQHGFTIGARYDIQYGMDFLRTIPETGGTISGVNENRDNMAEIGAYLHTRTRLLPRLDLVAAARLDRHSELPDPVFSPRVALVFTPRRDQGLRLSYNRAFSTPTALNLFLDIGGGPVPNESLAPLGYAIRAQAPGRDGFRYRVGNNTALHVRSPFNPAGAGELLEANSAELLHLAAGFLQARSAIDGSTADLLRSLQPTNDQVGVLLLDMLHPNRPARPQETVELLDVPGIRETTTNTFELGYTGLLGGRVLVAADVWHSRIKNFTSPLTPQNAYLAMLNGEQLASFLVESLIRAGVPVAEAQARAAALAPVIAGIPLGVVTSPDMAARGAELLATFRNFGDVRLSGADLAVRVELDRGWSLGANASVVSSDHLETDGEFIALNAPEFKGALSVGYTSSRLTGEARVRHTSEFPASSAVYFGTSCVLGDRGVGSCVEAATLFDLSLGYPLPALRGARVHLGIQNLFDTGYRSFVGVPRQGRLALARVSYEF